MIDSIAGKSSVGEPSGAQTAHTGAAGDSASAAPPQSGDELFRLLSAGYGASRNAIGKLSGMGVGAVNGWGKIHLGDEPGVREKEAEAAMQKAAAVLKELKEHVGDDPASWAEEPVLEGYGPSRMDLAARGRADLMLKLACGKTTPGKALAEINPRWETELRLEHEVFIADDGAPAIRTRRNSRD